MIRALRHAWLVFRFAFQHRHASRIVSDTRAEYPLTNAEAIDWEWELAQAEHVDADSDE